MAVAAHVDKWSLGFVQYFQFLQLDLDVAIRFYLTFLCSWRSFFLAAC